MLLIVYFLAKKSTGNNKLVRNVSPNNIFSNKEIHQIGDIVESYYNNGDKFLNVKLLIFMITVYMI